MTRIEPEMAGGIEPSYLSENTEDMALDHLQIDLQGVQPDRLRDDRLLASLLLSAANAAGLHPAQTPVLTNGARGVSAVLVCDGGHVTLVASPDEGTCCVDVAALDARAGRLERARDIFAKRLAAQEIRSNLKRRGWGGPRS